MPRFPGARLAFRTWNLEGGVLKSAGNVPWVNGEPTKARCNKYPRGIHPDGEPVPKATCDCGLHAYFRPPKGLYTQAGVLGACVMWGHSVFQGDGLRSQYALPVALTAVPTMQLGVYEAAKLYCEEWEIPWCDTIEELVEEGLRYADMVPKEEWVKKGDPDAVARAWEATPPPVIRSLRTTEIPRLQAAREPYRRGKRRHDARREARRRVRAKRKLS